MDTNEMIVVMPHIAYAVDIDPPITEAESRIVDTALGILPHLGPDATIAYLDRASRSLGNEHEA